MTDDARASLTRRMRQPQRHRLLQGYPAVPLMREAGPRHFDGSLAGDEGRRTPAQPAHIELDPSRKLIVGVIPHTMCRPKVRGCGFCTFGQDRYSRARMRHATSSLEVAIEQALRSDRHDFHGRRVEALYFGGGTANLTPLRSLEATTDRLLEALDLAEAELTLEGVPSLFLSRLGAPLRWLARLPVRRARISMGVQTFDPVQLERMGRTHFGDDQLVARVVRNARDKGLGTSGDFLINLPHQTREQMLADVDRAVDVGFEQICIYHLVLYEGMRTAWARDPALLAALPDNERACANWLAVRERLRSRGYRQSTLTNFEREDVHGTPNRFVYEELAYSPAEVDGLGIGRLSISVFVDVAQRRATKLVRSEHDAELGVLYFPLDAADLELLYLTRTLPRLRWDGPEYAGLFGGTLAQRRGEVLAALVDEGLVEHREGSVELTARGMFFADSIVGVIAEARVAELRAHAGGLHTADLIADASMG